MTDWLQVPVGLTPVVGWRAWHVSLGSQIRLYSLHQGTKEPWPCFKPMEAECGQKDQQSQFVGGLRFMNVTSAPMVLTTSLAITGITFPGAMPVVVAPPAPAPSYEDYWLLRHGAAQLTKDEIDEITRELHVTVGVKIQVNAVRTPEKPSIPSEMCSCGIYATTEIQEAINQIPSGTTGWGCAVGRVALWGEVVEHQTGYRGQFAYPQSLFLPSKTNARVAEELHQAYGVPTFDWSELRLPSTNADEADTSSVVMVDLPKSFVPTQRKRRRLRFWR